MRTAWQTWSLCYMHSFSTFGVTAVVIWHSKLLNLLFEGILHTQRQDCRCETSPHPKGWLLSDNRNAECAGESACWPTTTDRLRQYVIVWYCTLLYKQLLVCSILCYFFQSSHHISEARNICFLLAAAAYLSKHVPAASELVSHFSPLVILISFLSVL